MTPGALRAFVLLAALVLAAGCVGDHVHVGDDHHLGGGDVPPSVLVGVDNKGSRDLAVQVVLTAPNGTVEWSENFTAGAGNLPEKQHDLAGMGIYTLDVTYSWRAGDRVASGSDRVQVDTGTCPGLSHFTFTVDGTDGIEKGDVHTECHT